jgi:PRTRC genetic system protein C
MTIESMAREFRYDGLRLPDPNAKLSVDEVRTAFSATYPEIATAAVTGPEAVGNKLVYHFTKAIGTNSTEHGQKLCRVQRVSIMNQVTLTLENAVYRIGHVPGNLGHP